MTAFREKARNAAALVRQMGIARYTTSLLRHFLPAQLDWISTKWKASIASARFRKWRIQSGARVKFITFADGKIFSTARLASEVAVWKVFDEISCFDASALDDEFKTRYAEHLQHPRGLGFWAWKPYIIMKSLEQLDDGDILFYADAGCTAVADASHIMMDLVLKLAKDHSCLLLCANPYSSFITGHWTKADLFWHLGYEDNPNIRHAQQIEAGRIGIVKTERNLELIRQWASVSSNLHLIDDSPSVRPNEPGFIEHRHDQSIFSILVFNKTFITGLEEVFHATRIRAS